jgi:hypothetical protein
MKLLRNPRSASSARTFAPPDAVIDDEDVGAFLISYERSL